ncbi:putative 16S rRNA processing protein, function [Bradyrhizobium sp. ORS 375]|uniref:ribosome maturation factor RimM n=1 Tax=Bradyrhizobium sp. (strain ORS 375) TaxID=566679 RepID=UPI0002407F76|nr:ribosome maturation factor RimM [Bradyrhizobium sp. ORS 375]CCD90856.1 putative 16S rRNA processing protein, function [Bradyrhizobium sp. ORS 375]
MSAPSGRDGAPEFSGSKLICVAKIGAAHGVRGEVRLWTFTEDPLAVLHYGPLTTKDGSRSLEVAKAREAKDHLVASFKGVTDRNAAERLNGLELYVPRDRLPETDDNEYYHADLIGLAAETTAGAPLGRVLAIHNFGAGDIIEIAPPSGSTLMLPFTNAVVPTVDLTGGRVIIELPDEIDGEDRASADESASAGDDAAAQNSARHPRESGDP